MADQRITASYSSRYTFTGKEQDALIGLHYFGARYYDARISLWYGVDPMAEKYPDITPYGYTYNNPIKYTDPNGMYIVDPSVSKASSALAKYLKNNISELLKSDRLVKGMMKYGQFQSKQDLLKALTNDKGPLIKVDQVANNGDGYYSGGKDGTITIDIDLVEQFNNASPEDKEAAFLDVISTVLHETVHYGDWQDQNPEDNMDVMFDDVMIDGKMEKSRKLLIDKGHGMENEVYFKGKGDDTVDSIQNAKKVINSTDDKDLIPTVPPEK